MSSSVLPAAPPLAERLPAATGAQRPRWTSLGLGLTASGVLLAALLGRNPRHAALFGIALLLGVTLYHAAFGFTSAYRRLISERDPSGVQAQLLMLAVATVLFAPVLASGQALGHGVVGAIAPLSVQVAAGAFLFGIGMQLGGGCGSGTLYALGGGSARLLLTLAAFVAGSFWASLDMAWWWKLPSAGSLALGRSFGWLLGVALQLVFLGFLAWLLARVGRGRSVPSATVPATPLSRILLGPWPLYAGALGLALLNWITLLVAGHPWTITWAFTLWGAKAALLFGWDPGGDPFWTGGFPQAALAGGVLDDVTPIMDIGIVLGALCAAGLAGRFSVALPRPGRHLVAAVLGGLAMGYGARIAFGCNIGAFFSGVASTSLHGWLWIAMALPGTWLGVKLRPLFGMQN